MGLYRPKYNLPSHVNDDLRFLPRPKFLKAYQDNKGSHTVVLANRSFTATLNDVVQSILFHFGFAIRSVMCPPDLRQGSSYQLVYGLVQFLAEEQCGRRDDGVVRCYVLIDKGIHQSKQAIRRIICIWLRCNDYTVKFNHNFVVSLFWMIWKVSKKWQPSANTWQLPETVAPERWQ